MSEGEVWALHKSWNEGIANEGYLIRGVLHLSRQLQLALAQAAESWEGAAQLSYLSALRVVRVKTETPTEVSWMAGMSLQPTSPKSHSSEKYREASTGTQVTSSSRSPAARLEMKMLGTLLMALLEMKIFMRVMLPSKPTVMMSR